MVEQHQDSINDLRKEAWRGHSVQHAATGEDNDCNYRMPLTSYKSHPDGIAPDHGITPITTARAAEPPEEEYLIRLSKLLLIPHVTAWCYQNKGTCNTKIMKSRAAVHACGELNLTQQFRARKWRATSPGPSTKLKLGGHVTKYH